MAWTKDGPLKVGLHPPEQCARGRLDCRSLAQVVSDDGATFVCCGEVAPGRTPDPRDKWAFCVKGDQARAHCAGTDVRIFVDRIDMVDMVGVLATGVSMTAER